MLKKFKQMFQSTPAEQVPVLSPAKGTLVPMGKIPDPTFAEGMIGPCVAFQPSVGALYAPVDAEILSIFPTLHAITFRGTDGAEWILHAGLDTVQLKGEGFMCHVNVGQKVKAGDLILSFDLEALQSKGYNMITPLVLVNANLFAFELPTEEKSVEVGTPVFQLIEK